MIDESSGRAGEMARQRFAPLHAKLIETLVPDYLEEYINS